MWENEFSWQGIQSYRFHSSRSVSCLQSRDKDVCSLSLTRLPPNFLWISTFLSFPSVQHWKSLKLETCLLCLRIQGGIIIRHSIVENGPDVNVVRSTSERNENNNSLFSPRDHHLTMEEAKAGSMASFCWECFQRGRNCRN